MKNFLENHFHLSESGTNVRTELLAGVTTFATMAYILIVQANFMVAAGMNGAGVMLATALISGYLPAGKTAVQGKQRVQHQHRRMPGPGLTRFFLLYYFGCLTPNINH